MKIVAILVLLLAVQARAADYEFLPADPRLSLSFKGETQAGIETHILQLRQLSHLSTSGVRAPTSGFYVIYYAGREYGPEILGRIDGHAPILRKVGNDVEIYFISGARTHIRQTWRLQNNTATKVSEKTISWEERRNIETHNQAL